jgi:hypothetical protein
MNETCMSFVPNRVLLALVILCSSCVPVSTFADFDYVNFSSSTGLNLVQNAVVTGNLLRLTDDSAYQQGAAWYAASQFVQSGFETKFRFRVATKFFDGGDGFVFVIQNQSPSAIGDMYWGGSSLGYDRIPNSVAVEFDTFQLPGVFGDPNDNHISVHTRGTLPNDIDEKYSLGHTGTSLATNLSDRFGHDVAIRYLPGTLSIHLDNAVTPSLTVPLDLPSTLSLNGGRAYVGFTSATGGAWERHEILSWSFRAVPEPAASFMAIIGIGMLASLRRARPKSSNAGMYRSPWNNEGHVSVYSLRELLLLPSCR